MCIYIYIYIFIIIIIIIIFLYIFTYYIRRPARRPDAPFFSFSNCATLPLDQGNISLKLSQYYWKMWQLGFKLKTALAYD